MWILEPEFYEKFEQKCLSAAISQQAVDDYLAALSLSRGRGRPTIMSVEGSTAHINIEGVLTKQADFFAMIFGDGNTTYSDIIESALDAETDPKVKDVVLNIDSPGGDINGLFEAVDAIAAMSKPVTTVVNGTMASAAYAIGAQANKIIASNRSNSIGSIGVVGQFRLPGDNVVTITSTEAPEKRPDLKTEEGRAAVQARIDEIHGLFAKSVADGRGVSEEKVNQEFGRGASLLAAQALERGMIDEIVPQKTKPAASKAGGSKPKAIGAKTMTLEELLAQHPQLAAQLRQEGYQAGAEAERSRVSAHLKYGSMCGDFKAAHEAISSGAAITDESVAAYMEAAFNARMAQSRRDDDQNESDNVSGKDEPEDKSKASEVDVVKATAEKLGLVLEV